MENISKLEERLEQSRKQRKILKHELGAGKPCLLCKEKCVGGLNLHFWRKICINCKCPKEKHDLLPEDYDDDSHIFDVLGVKIPDHKNLYRYIRKNATARVSSEQEKTDDVEWVPIVLEKDDAKRNEKIDKYFEDLGGERHIPFIKSEAAINRKVQATLQIPPHDFSSEKCDNLSEIEAAKLKHYVDNIKTNYFGQGQVDVVENSTTNPFHSTMSNLNDAVNNNMNEMIQKLSIGSDQLMCRACEKHITSAFVKAERLGKNAQWHPKCFRCKKCSQLLVDLIYFHYNNEIYCARDLAAMMDIPRCAACDELILVSEFTLADGKNYHLKHFCCINCEKSLAGYKYINDEKTNNPVCLSCYDLIYANKCSICTGIIAPNVEGISFKDFHYHVTCFSCSNKKCSKELIGSRFCIKGGIPFCSASCVNSMTN